MATGYEGYQGYGTTDPNSVALRLAQAQLMAGMSTAPIRSRTQGYAQLVQALMGGMSLGQAQRQQAGSNLTLGGGAPAPSAGGAMASPPDMTLPGGENMNDVPLGDELSGTHMPTAPQGPPAATMAPNNAAGGPPGVHPRFAPQLPPGFTPPPSASQPGAGGSGAALVGMQQARGQGGGQDLDAALAADGQPAPPPPGQGQLAQLMQNIARTESGGNYGAINKQSGALGKYQVMPFNVGPWTQEALGQEMTPQQFLNSPQAQEAVAQHKIGGYMAQYGPEGAARAWFTGSPNGTGSDGNMNADRYAQLATQGPGGATPRAMVAGPGSPSNPAAYATPQNLDAMMGQDSGAPPQGQGAQQGSIGGVNTTQLAGMPSMQRLMEVLQNPYASPATKELAQTMFQRYMAINSPHPFTYEKLANGDEVQIDSLTGVPTGRRLTGSPKYSMTMGKDIMGQDQPTVFDEHSGQIVQGPQGASQGAAGGFQPFQATTPAGPSPNGAPGQPVATPPAGQPSGPQVWQQGQPIAPAIDGKIKSLIPQYTQNPQGQAIIYQYVTSLLQGNRQFLTAGGAVAKDPKVEIAEAIAGQVDPDGMPQTRFDTIKQNADVSTPTALGGQRMAAQTSVRHLGSLAEASDLLGQQGQLSSSELGAKVQDWAQRNMGGASGNLVTASQAYNAALVPVLGEIDKLYKGGQATEGEIDQMKANLSSDASPAARRSALNMLSGLLQDKVNVLQNTWHMGVGKNFPDLPIIDQQGQAGLDYIKGWNANARAPVAGGVTPLVQGRGGAEQPPMPGAVRGARGNWLVPDPNRPGKYLQVQ
jgi:hypothetical protein